MIKDFFQTPSMSNSSRNSVQATATTVASFEDNPKSSPRSSPKATSPKKIRKTFITLEVHYARGRDAFKTAQPYLREPVSVSLDDEDPFTFRSFLRYGLFEKRPELKYRDNEVVFYQTPNGTNLLTLMDQPIGALPELLGRSEQKLLKVIIKGNEKLKYNVLVDKKLTYRNPNGSISAWPRTKLEGPIPEDNSVKDWRPRPFKLDDWKDPKKRRLMIIVIFAALILLTGIIVPLVIFLPNKSGDQDNGSDSDSAFYFPTISPAPTKYTTPSPTPRIRTKYDHLRDVVLQVSDPNLLNDRFSPQSYALNWLANEDEADLGAFLCSTLTGGDGDLFTDDEYYYNGDVRKRHLRTRTLQSFVCNDAERVIRRYALAAFYFATIDMAPPPASTDDDAGDFEERSRRLEWIDTLNFLSGDHECSWHRNSTEGEVGEIITQGVICKNEIDGHIILDAESSNSTETVGMVALNINEPNELIGKLPQSIFHVERLQEIHLANNEMTGEIPIKMESSIERLQINYNNFTGSIEFLSNFTNLTEARLDHNMFNGEIPSTIGQMVNLRVLTLGDNLFSGSMPDEICVLRKEHELEFLEADCGGTNPKIQCDCCTSCFGS